MRLPEGPQRQTDRLPAAQANFGLLMLPVCAGPGAFDFKQGDTNGTIFWRVVRDFLKDPSAEQIACQAPKPILLDTGSVHIPYEWCALPLKLIQLRWSRFSFGFQAIPTAACVALSGERKGLYLKGSLQC